MALGVDKIALWGTSYGTKLALAYALAYPTHVERLLLDSVLPTDYPEPLEANVLHDMPLALSGSAAPARAVRQPRTSRATSRLWRTPSPARRLAVPFGSRTGRCGTSAWTVSTCSRSSSTRI